MRQRSLYDTLSVIVSRRDVEQLNTEPTLAALRELTESPAIARAHMEKVDIGFQGYNHDSSELFEIPEVRRYVAQLDDQFPFWLFFLSKHQLGLQCITFCFLPPFLTEEGKARIHPRQLQDLLERRWFPAMNHVAMYAGLSEREIQELTDRVLLHLTKGRLRAR